MKSSENTHTHIIENMTQSVNFIIPGCVITEFCWYVVLDLFSFHSFLHFKHLRGAEGGAASKHVEQSILQMEAFILTPVEE